MVASVPAGKLKHRVRIMRDIDQLTGGQSLPVPTQLAEVWAWVQPLASRELAQVRQTLPEVSHRVTLHYRAGLTASDWLEHNGGRLAISSLINVQNDNTVLELLCVEQTGGG